MKWIKDLKNKTWIEWLKITVALDIASAGIGLIINLPLHIIAPIIGFVTRIIMGVMYIFVAVLILKRIFPGPSQNNDEPIHTSEKKDVDVDIKNGIAEGRHLFKKFIAWVVRTNNIIIDSVDNILDSIELFFTKKKVEVKKEVKELLEK